MSDPRAHAALSRFAIHKTKKLLDEHKKLKDKFQLLISLAGLADRQVTTVDAAFSGRSQNTASSESASSHIADADTATPEDQREAYMFFRHHTHLCFAVYRLYMRGLVMPHTVSSSELCTTPLLPLMTPSPSVLQRIQTASQGAAPKIYSLMRWLFDHPDVQSCTRTSPPFVALSDMFYTDEATPLLGGDKSAKRVSAALLSVEDALAAAGVLRQIVLALASDYATITPLSGETGLQWGPHGAGPLLLRYQLLAAVQREVMQLAHPDNDTAVRRQGYELAVCIVNYQLMGAATRTVPSPFTMRSDTSRKTIASLSEGTDDDPLHGRKTSAESSETLSPKDLAEELVLTFSFSQHMAVSDAPRGQATLSEHEKYIASSLDWDYFVQSYPSAGVVIPGNLQCQRRAGRESSAVLSHVDSSFEHPKRHSCLPTQRRGSGGSILLERARDALLMLRFLLEMPMKCGQRGRAALLPNTFPFVTDSSGSQSILQVTPAFNNALRRGEELLRRRWWSLIKNTLFQVFYPSIFFEAVVHHDERLGDGRAASASTHAALMLSYWDGFRDAGIHPRAHSLFVELIVSIYHSTCACDSSTNESMFRYGSLLEQLQGEAGGNAHLHDRILAEYALDMRLLCLICVTTMSYAGSATVDMDPLVVTASTPATGFAPSSVTQAHSVLLDMLRRPPSLLRMTHNGGRLCPLSDYLTALIEGSFLMLATPKIVVPPSTLEEGIRFNSFDGAGSPGRFQDTLKYAADIGLFRSAAAQSTYGTLCQNAASAMQDSGGDPERLDSILFPYLSDPTQSTVYNYNCFYECDDPEGRESRDVCYSGLHFLISTKLARAATETDDKKTSSLPISQCFVECWCELLHALAQSDTASTRDEAPNTYLTATRAKYAAVYALAAIVAELSVQAAIIAKPIGEAITFANACLWGSCLAKIRSETYVAPLNESTTFRTLTRPFLFNVMNPSLRAAGVAAHNTCMKGVDTTIHFTNGSAYPVPIVIRTWSEIITALSSVWMASILPSTRAPDFAWPFASSFALAPYLTPYRKTRKPMTAECVIKWITEIRSSPSSFTIVHDSLRWFLADLQHDALVTRQTKGFTLCQAIRNITDVDEKRQQDPAGRLRATTILATFLPYLAILAHTFADAFANHTRATSGRLPVAIEALRCVARLVCVQPEVFDEKHNLLLTSMAVSLLEEGLTFPRRFRLLLAESFNCSESQDILGWFPEGVSASTCASAFNKNVSPVVDAIFIKDPVACTKLSDTSSLVDDDINALLGAQLILLELFNSNTPLRVGDPVATATGLRAPARGPLCITHRLLPLMADVACFTLLLAPAGEHYDTHQVMTEGAWVCSARSTDVSKYLVTRDSPVVGSPPLSRRAVSLYHNLVDKKAAALGVLAWSVADAAEVGDEKMLSQLVRKILIVLDTVFLVSGPVSAASGCPFAQLARTLSSVAVVVLSPCRVKDNVESAKKVIDLCQRLFCSPALFRRDPRLVQMFSTCCCTIAQCLEDLFRVETPASTEVTSIYSSFITSIVAVIFLYCHDATWRSEEGSEPDAGLPLAPRRSMARARQSFAHSSQNACIAEVVITNCVILTRLVSTIRHLWLLIDAPSTEGFPAVTLNQLLVDAVQLLTCAETTHDYWVHGSIATAPPGLLLTPYRPLSLFAHVLPSASSQDSITTLVQELVRSMEASLVRHLEEKFQSEANICRTLASDIVRAAAAPLLPTGGTAEHGEWFYTGRAKVSLTLRSGVGHTDISMDSKRSTLASSVRTIAQSLWTSGLTEGPPSSFVSGLTLRGATFLGGLLVLRSTLMSMLQEVDAYATLILSAGDPLSAEAFSESGALCDSFADLLTVSTVAVPGRPSILCPWVHAASTSIQSTAISQVARALGVDAKEQPPSLNRTLVQLFGIAGADEAPRHQTPASANALTVSLLPNNCRAPMLLNVVATLLCDSLISSDRAEVQCRLSPGLLIRTPPQSGDSTVLSVQSHPERMQIDRVTALGLSTFSARVLSGSITPKTTTAPASPSVNVPRPGCRPSAALDAILSDFNCSAFVPLPTKPSSATSPDVVEREMDEVMRRRAKSIATDAADGTPAADDQCPPSPAFTPLRPIASDSAESILPPDAASAILRQQTMSGFVSGETSVLPAQQSYNKYVAESRNKSMHFAAHLNPFESKASPDPSARYIDFQTLLHASYSEITDSINPHIAGMKARGPPLPSVHGTLTTGITSPLTYEVSVAVLCIGDTIPVRKLFDFTRSIFEGVEARDTLSMRVCLASRSVSREDAPTVIAKLEGSICVVVSDVPQDADQCARALSSQNVSVLFLNPLSLPGLPDELSAVACSVLRCGTGLHLAPAMDGDVLPVDTSAAGLPTPFRSKLLSLTSAFATRRTCPDVNLSETLRLEMSNTFPSTLRNIVAAGAGLAATTALHS